jgi:hypothetical protein
VGKFAVLGLGGVRGELGPAWLGVLGSYSRGVLDMMVTGIVVLTESIMSNLVNKTGIAARRVQPVLMKITKESGNDFSCAGIAYIHPQRGGDR